MRKFAILLVISCILGITSVINASFVQLEKNVQFSIVATNFVKVSFNHELNAIDEIYADFLGGKNFSVNLLSKPLQLEINTGGKTSQYFKNYLKSAQLDSAKSSNGDQILQIESMMSLDQQDLIQHTWNVHVSPTSRKIEIETQGKVLQDLEVVSVSYGLYLPNLSLYALFESGIAQMMGQSHSCLGSNETLDRAYFMGGGSAMDTKFSTVYSQTTQQTPEVVFISSTNEAYKSAVQYVIFGNYPRKSKKMISAWSKACWTDAKAVTVPAGAQWTSKVELIPNNYNFPAYLVSNVEDSLHNMPFDYLQAYLMAVYGSPVGCAQSYYENQQGIIAPTISHPDVGYSPDTNFFDPDNFITLSAMMYSGDDYLMKQVQQILERTAETMCGIGTNQDKKYCGIARQRLTHKPMQSDRFHRLFAQQDTRYHATSRAGQLMHHFISLSPTYESIAGSEQLGPNIFWTWCTLRYISMSQDDVFAAKMFPFIDLSTKFILSFVDASKEYMINAPGPLWIDVLVRENYTSDSNAMMVPILQEIAQYYEYMQQDTAFATELRTVSDQIQSAVNRNLWSSTGDHLITQLNGDGSIRDFIDYDANLIAVAFDVIPTDKRNTVLAKVDNGSYTHIRATWCSEIPYTGNREDCYIVGGTVCGDSVVTLARIGWVDALARKRVRDVTMVKEVLLQPLINDLVANVWLYERYDNKGQQIRTSYYFEYPSLITIILREVIYGIEIALNHVTIDPIVYEPFTYQVGNTKVSYAQELVTIQVDTATQKGKVCNLYHMVPGGRYTVQNTCMNNKGEEVVTADAEGVLSFNTIFGQKCEVKVVKSSTA